MMLPPQPHKGIYFYPGSLKLSQTFLFFHSSHKVKQLGWPFLLERMHWSHFMLLTYKSQPSTDPRIPCCTRMLACRSGHEEEEQLENVVSESCCIHLSLVHIYWFAFYWRSTNGTHCHSSVVWIPFCSLRIRGGGLRSWNYFFFIWVMHLRCVVFPYYFCEP